MREKEEDIMRGDVRVSVRGWRGQCKRWGKGQFERVEGRQYDGVCEGKRRGGGRFEKVERERGREKVHIWRG